MISSVESQSSGLTQRFFQNRFPEPKDEPLLSLENSKKSNDETSTPASQQQSGMEQTKFAQVIQNAALTPKAPKEESSAERQNGAALHQDKNKFSEKDAYERLTIKAQYNTLFR